MRKRKTTETLKARSTIRREMRRLRAFIDAHNANPAFRAKVDQAYAAECALQWATERTSWTPLGVVLE